MSCFMYINFLCIALPAICVYFLWRSKKSLRHVCREIVYEIIYNILGLKALLEDHVIREKFQNDIPLGTGKVALITGGARGIGVEVMKKLLIYDYHVIIGCRSVMAGKELFGNIRKWGISTGDVQVFQLDLCSLESVKSFADIVNEKYDKIHLLINNAGKMFGPYMETVDGFESQFSTNYLGHFYLTHLLLPKLTKAGQADHNARIVNVSSCAYSVGNIDFDDINMRKEHIPPAAYAQAKLAQVLFTCYLNSLLKVNCLPVSVYCVHPGIVNTDLFNDTYLKKIVGARMLSILFKTPEQGAISVLYAALSSELENFGGSYVSNGRIRPLSKIACSADLQKKLFDFTNDTLNIEVFGKALTE